MKPMSDNFFLDSNICLYLLGNDSAKRNTALELLNNNPTISTQVLNENINVLFKKFKLFSISDIEIHLGFLQQNCAVEIITVNTIISALKIKKRYQLQWYDSLIVATALQKGCSILYSEDMQHRLVIEKQLSIINPFL